MRFRNTFVKFASIMIISLFILLSHQSLSSAQEKSQSPNNYGVVDASKFQSIQAALDAHPGKMVFLPDGDYRIEKAIKITTAGSGLYGFGTIIQENPDEHILLIENANDVRIYDIKLTRSQTPWGKAPHAILVDHCQSVWLEKLKIVNNRSTIAAVELIYSRYCRVQDCEIINYKTITIDDRINNDLYRYAFNAIDGHGLMVINCDATQIIRNRIIEKELHATKEIQETYELGKIVKRAEELGSLAKYGVEDNFVVIWHQGAGMRVTGNLETRFTLIDGNYIENVAQGIDLHTDQVIVTNNHITNAYMGMKAMHGSSNVMIANNVFHQPGKYGILLRPGSESYNAQPAENNNPEREANVERGIIVSNNIISDMGYGDEAWRLWNDNPELSYPVAMLLGYGPLEKNPPLQDVIIEGNIIYDRGTDQVLVDGKPQVIPPRYKWAVWFDKGVDPKGFHFKNNIFHPGTLGIANKEMMP